jgi:biopolymer transport protein TolQ
MGVRVEEFHEKQRLDMFLFAGYHRKMVYLKDRNEGLNFMPFLAANPFVNAYLLADWFGKGIFWILFILSAISWTVLVYKCWQMLQIRRLSREFSELFFEQKDQPLSFQYSCPPQGRWTEIPHPYFEVYKTAKQNALQLINRNHFQNHNEQVILTSADLDLIESQTIAAAIAHSKSLDKNLFVLSTVVTLGPFLGLLGTVWGILVTFSQLPHGFSTSNTAMLTGLSMALAATVIGLLIAIPALVGHNFLKNASREYKRDLEHFVNCLLASIEMQYRKDR